MKLRYTLPALADLDAILTYIDQHAPQGAMRVKSRIQTIITLLVSYPLIGTRVTATGIRRMTASPYPYLIFYEPTDTELIIHAIRHGARDPASMPQSN